MDELNNQKGEGGFKLFSGSQGFPYSNKNAVKRQCVKVTDNSLTIALKNVESGSYAASIFHDLNGDRQLNRNSLGMPTEGYGFSNNPVVRDGQNWTVLYTDHSCRQQHTKNRAVQFCLRSADPRGKRAIWDKFVTES